MNAPSRDVKDIIELSSSAISLTFGTDLFVSKEPSTPDRVATIYDSGGAGPLLQHTLDEPSVQVMVRGRRSAGSYEDAYTLMEEIKLALHGIANQTVNGTRYILIQAITDILFLGYDDNDRPMLSLNFRILRTA